MDCWRGADYSARSAYNMQFANRPTPDSHLEGLGIREDEDVLLAATSQSTLVQ